MMIGRGFGHGFVPYGYGCGIFPMILGILLLGIVLVLILKNRHTKSAHIGHPSNALEILNERFAKGEITQEEYEKIKKVIN